MTPYTFLSKKIVGIVALSAIVLCTLGLNALRAEDMGKLPQPILLTESKESLDERT